MGESSPILTIYHKITTDFNGDVVEKYIMFDEESELPYIYISNKSIPAKLYLPPVEGQLRKDTMAFYAEKNGYKAALVLMEDDAHTASLVDNKVICKKLQFKKHMDIVNAKLNEYLYDDIDTVVMCSKLRTCLLLFK